jgi:integrase
MKCDNSIPSHYYLEFYWGGKQRQLYSDERGRPIDSLARAKFLREDILYEIQNGTFNIKNYMKVKDIKTSILLDQFLNEKLKQIAPSFISNYTGIIKAAKSFFGGKNIRDIRKEDLINYQNHLFQTKKDASPATVKNYVVLFRVFLNWCKDRELIQLVPPSPMIECPKPTIKWFNQEDQLKVYNAIREPDKPIVLFSMLHGTRPGETRALKVKDVNLDNKSINLHATFSHRIYRPRRKGRGSPSVTIPIHPECWNYIYDRVKTSLPDAWLFPNPLSGKEYPVHRWFETWKLALEGLKIEGITPYQITRHSFASQLSAAGISPLVIKNLMGHTNINTTMKYTGADLGAMRTAIEKLSVSKDSTKVLEFRRKN